MSPRGAAGCGSDMFEPAVWWAVEVGWGVVPPTATHAPACHLASTGRLRFRMGYVLLLCNKSSRISQLSDT